MVRNPFWLDEFGKRLAGDLLEDLHRLRDVCMPAPITLADLPPALRERFIGRSGAWLLQVFCKDSLWEFGPLEHFGDTFQVPVGLGALYSISNKLDVGGQITFPNLAGKDGTADFRAIDLFVNFRL